MKRLLVALSVAASMAAGAGWAFAGEVKGPPGTVDNTNYTGARTNANSNCAYSGLNDFDSADPGQNRFKRADGGRLVEVLRRSEGHPGQTRSLSRRDERQSRALDRASGGWPRTQSGPTSRAHVATRSVHWCRSTSFGLTFEIRRAGTKHPNAATAEMYDGDETDRERVIGADPVEHGRHRARQRERPTQSDGKADDREPHAAPKHERPQVSRARSKRRSNAHFLRPFGDHVQHHTVNTYRREQQRNRCEQRRRAG